MLPQRQIEHGRQRKASINRSICGGFFTGFGMDSATDFGLITLQQPFEFKWFIGQQGLNVKKFAVPQGMNVK